ncbi:putative damage-inducible protein DinB [Pedobacter africanus]|uniref:Damage-inducible protein DinB n=1 Tax=Pedobacter africanus TaxID=151894 RepID=A0ACC6KSG7_9SPHI|nr:DinB family protein [Pedobacter africanus]MDR6782041.1 putative damage-inducible protein DinB [Pedobacter africanus]
MTTPEITTENTLFISAQDLLNHWLGHRRLTRRVIEAFPDDKLFDHSIGGMRPFATMVKELIDVSGPGVQGIATSDWSNSTGFDEHSTKGIASKAALLDLFDESTEIIASYLPSIPAERFQQSEKAFGMYEGIIFDLILYFIDNEIHHRAQGTVYLRSLGIEPPAFYNRD